MKRKANYFTVYEEFDIDIGIDQILNNLNCFTNEDLRLLKDNIIDELNDKSQKYIIEPSTLEDEYKIQILKEFFDKFTWAELEEIKKKIL